MLPSCLSTYLHIKHPIVGDIKYGGNKIKGETTQLLHAYRVEVDGKSIEKHSVEIEEFKREKGLIRMGALIWIEREGQKHIVIGKGGSVLKKVGTQARHALQELLGEKVFLKLWVKVSPEWSDNERALKQFGYDD